MVVICVRHIVFISYTSDLCNRVSVKAKLISLHNYVSVKLISYTSDLCNCVSVKLISCIEADPGPELPGLQPRSSSPCLLRTLLFPASVISS
jgi:hypothetical protein